MEFFNEHGQKIEHTRWEVTEQKQAVQYVRYDMKVLELGARYGTVSCICSTIIQNPNHVVVVEPDRRVWDALEKNMRRNHCEFTIVKGVISRQPVMLTGLDCCNGYGSTSVKSESSDIPNYTLEEIEAANGVKFDTLIADCEGFLETFLDENPQLYDQLKLVMFERDYPDKCNYDKITTILREKGFTQLVGEPHEVWLR